MSLRLGETEPLKSNTLMIIKVPIYVEIESISDQGALEPLVKCLSISFTHKIRKDSYEKELKLINSHYKGAKISDLKVITQKDALESLRVKK